MRHPVTGLLLLLALLPAAAGCPLGAAPFPGGPLVVGAFPQRRADRYQRAHGLPGARVTAVEVVGRRVRVQTDGGPASFSDGRWQPGGPAPADGLALVDRARLPAGERVLGAARGDDGQVWVVTDAGVYRGRGGAYSRFPFPTAYLTRQQPVNIDAEITCVTTDSQGSVWFGSSAGIFATDGANWWNSFDRSSGLPYEDVTCLALAPNGDIWAGTTEGVCRYTGGGWQYYWGPRWLPHNRVNDVAVDADGAAWVATEGGVARLYDESVTLEQKARHFQRITDTRHNRYGFVTGAALKQPGNPAAGVIHEASDNDGLWTAVYVAAQSFRWAATRDPEARAAARKSMFAMLDLVKYSGVPGFPARAILRKGEPDVAGYNPDETVRVPGEKDKIWYQSPVDPQVLCKGDTSSDELDGHYFAWHVFYDLVADEAERRTVRAVVKAVTDHILDHELTLVGPTGRKTRWGVWHPKYINDDPTWWEERGLNSLELLAYLKVAEHICGDARYTRMYRMLIREHHYLLNCVSQKVAEPWWDLNHSDDQMAFMMYYSLMLLEKDPAAQRVLRQSMERSWKEERPEASPFFNFVYGATMNQPCDVEASVAALRDWPWELIEWEVRGTHRHDVRALSRNVERRTRQQTDRALPASERRIMRWNGNPYQCDGGSPNGASEDDGSAWLLPYWLGRHHGFITEMRSGRSSAPSGAR